MGIVYYLPVIITEEYLTFFFAFFVMYWRIECLVNMPVYRSRWTF